MSAYRWILVPVLTAAVGTAWMALPGRPVEQQGPKTAVVDITRCFEKYARLKDENANLEKYRKDMNEKIKKLEEDYKKLKTDLKALPKESQTLRKDFIIKLNKLEAEIKTEEKLAERIFTDMFNDARVNMYNDIRGAIAKVATERGLDLVLKTEEPLLDIDSEESVSLRVSTRSVLHWSKELDLTDDVIRRANEEYAKKPRDGK